VHFLFPPIIPSSESCICTTDLKKENVLIIIVVVVNFLYGKRLSMEIDRNLIMFD
jgi:hypothetical protein